jgi:hypothetical protein
MKVICQKKKKNGKKINHRFQFKTKNKQTTLKFHHVQDVPEGCGKESFAVFLSRI